ncbi:MAG: peroxiredoxin [Rhodanobacter sp.]|jgi:peroxiredoxin|nr:peroxiredoxin [Rhodanobacter sp.]
MTIQPGDTIPDIAIQVIDQEIRPAQTGALFAGRKVLLFGVPGAFTPTCSTRHLPGYSSHFGDFRERDITVMCLAVNDAYVMQAWAASQQTPAGLLMLADGNASFTRALGLQLDGTAFGMGLRTRRFALLAEHGVVRLLQVEAPGEFRVSSAEAMLAAIGK